MSENKKLYDQLFLIYQGYEEEIKKLDDELDKLGRQTSSIVVKTINGNKYYYEQWREGSSTKSRNLGKVEPGAVAEFEKHLQARKEKLLQYAELLALRDRIKKECDYLQEKDKEEEKHLLDDYSFEVFYKNELSARVSAKKSRVHVSRYIIHPVKQLFYSDNITRDQLNEILKLRCFDEGRPDAKDKLKAMGLSEYNPQKIVKITHGVSYNDYLWFRFPGEKLRAEDVLVRDEYVEKRKKR